MKKVGVAILGLGVVGGGTYKMLTEHRDFYKKIHGIDIVVESVLERNRARAISLGVDDKKIAKSIEEICNNPDVDIVVEVLGGIEPAKTFALSALNAGKSVVTSNKELFCKYSHELEKAAKANACGLFYEATCVGGVPIIRSLLDCLQGNKINCITGIVNSTTNYILTKMTDCGVSYKDALKEAQSLGYAEANPSADVEGFDPVYKLSILSSLAFHTKVPYTKIYREGITKIESDDLSYGKRLGYVLKLLVIGKNTDSGVEVRVHPAFIKSTHQLAGVNDSYNAVCISGDCVEDVLLYGRGAGAVPTASAIAGDIIYYATHKNFNYSPFENTEDADPATKFITDFKSAYYVRLQTHDTGALTKATSVLEKYGISVKPVIRENGGVDGVGSIILVTGETFESYMHKAVEEINASKGLVSVASLIRVC